MGHALRIATIAAALAAGLFTAGPTPAEASSPTGGIRGVVTSEAFGLALPSVSVTLRSETVPSLEVQATDIDGAFEFDGLPAGLYSLEAWRDGFRRATITPIVVVPGHEVTEHIVLGVEEEPEAPQRPVLTGIRYNPT